MVTGESQRHAPLDPDLVVALSLDNHRTLFNTADGQDPRLRRVDDGEKLANAKHPKVSQAEGAAAILLGAQLLVATARS